MNRLRTLQTVPNRVTHARLRAPRVDLVTTYWRAVGPSRRPVVCALYRTNMGLKVRIGYGPDDVLRWQRVVSAEVGAAVAAIWKEATMSVGSFLDLDATS